MKDEIQEIFDLHDVTAGEAAAGQLWGCFQPHTRSVWGAALTVLDEVEEWDLLSLECYHSTAAGLDYHGRLISLFSCNAPGGVISMLPQTTRCQYMGQRVGLAYPMRVKRGFAVLEINPGLIAGDRLVVTAKYKVVNHGR